MSFRVYINNIRGFCESIIPIERMNFLIGENSTGKTSLIKIIEEMSAPFFLIMRSRDIWKFYDDITREKDFTIGISNGTCASIMSFKKDKNTERPYMYKAQKRIEGIVIKIELKKEYIHMDLKKEEEETFESHIESYNSSTKYPYKTKINKNDSKDIRDYFNKLSSIFNEKTTQKRNEENQDLGEQLVALFSFFINSPITSMEMIRTRNIREAPKKFYQHDQVENANDARCIFKTLDKLQDNDLSSDFWSFGKKSGLFDYVSINNLTKNKFSPFQIMIKKYESDFSIDSLGFGLSQIMPIICEIQVATSKRTKENLISILQPEIHLHPKAQAAFGEFIYSRSKNSDTIFLIETHSDFIVDRYRYTLNTSDEKISSQILFFSSNKEGKNEIHPIQIENGYYSENQPIEFRDFFINESIKMLEM